MKIERSPIPGSAPRPADRGSHLAAEQRTYIFGGFPEILPFPRLMFRPLHRTIAHGKQSSEIYEGGRMQRLARAAIGTVQPGADATFVSWALMAAFEKAGLRVQSFAARACFFPHDGGAAITGQATRHLDTWLLEPSACRLLFDRGCSGSDFALVQGRFDAALSHAEEMGGKLATLCEWLDMPSIAVIDGCLLRDCQLPDRPSQVDAVLIDGTQCCSERCRLQTCLEALWGVPVLGFVEDLPRLRAEVARLTIGTAPSRALCEALGAQAIPSNVLAKIEALATSREPSWRSMTDVPEIPSQRPLRVAMAYDDAFHCYFPDAMDQLELLGAEVMDFSPLRDDRLPPDIGLVLFGCGHPEQFYHPLAENCCLASALKKHVESGGRLYAEGGGLAYLGQSIRLANGQQLPMSGVLPIEASIEAEMQPPRAVELELTRECWLGEIGSVVRGYRTGFWKIKPLDSSARCIADDAATDFDVLAYQNAVGSRVHVNFAMQAPLMNRVFDPGPAGMHV